MKKIAVKLILSILLLTACSPAEASRSLLNLSEKDASQSFDVAKGGQVIVTLPGNITTGYTWEMAPAADQILEQSGKPGYKPSSNALGAGGEITLSFTAVKTGSTRLKLVYHRPWETTVAPLKTYEVSITVK